MAKKIPLRIEYDNCLELCGTVIRKAMMDYANALYHQMRGIKVYNHPTITERKLYTNQEIKHYEEFFTEEGLEFWGQGLINADYIKAQAEKLARDTYEMEKQIKGMTTEQIELCLKLCKKELKNRKDKR